MVAHALSDSVLNPERVSIRESHLSYFSHRRIPGGVYAPIFRCRKHRESDNGKQTRTRC